MSASHDHIMKSFDQELGRLRRTVLQMGDLAQSELRGAIEALRQRDDVKATAVFESDATIDDLEAEIERSAAHLLALRQPMATDLREVLAAIRIATDLERVGDHAANVAKRAVTLSHLNWGQPVSPIQRMANLVAELLFETLQAYEHYDAARALSVWQRDEEVDEMYTSLFRETLTYMMEDARNITGSTHALFIAKNIERIGDHATNIAESVHYLVTGRRIEGGRPKRDVTSFETGEGGETALQQ